MQAFAFIKIRMEVIDSDNLNFSEMHNNVVDTINDRNNILGQEIFDLTAFRVEDGYFIIRGNYDHEDFDLIQKDMVDHIAGILTDLYHQKRWSGLFDKRKAGWNYQRYKRAYREETNFYELDNESRVRIHDREKLGMLLYDLPDPEEWHPFYYPEEYPEGMIDDGNMWDGEPNDGFPTSPPPYYPSNFTSKDFTLEYHRNAKCQWEEFFISDGIPDSEENNVTQEAQSSRRQKPKFNAPISDTEEEMILNNPRILFDIYFDWADDNELGMIFQLFMAGYGFFHFDIDINHHVILETDGIRIWPMINLVQPKESGIIIIHADSSTMDQKGFENTLLKMDIIARMKEMSGIFRGKLSKSIIVFLCLDELRLPEWLLKEMKVINLIVENVVEF